MKADKRNAEKLLVTVFESILPICQLFGITTKRASDLLMFAHVRALEKQGRTRIEMRPVTGLSAKTVRRIATSDHSADETDLVANVIGDWNADSNFPPELNMDGKWPSFQHLCDQYGKDLTPSALSKALMERGVAEVTQEKIHLTKTSLIASHTHADTLRVASDAIRDLIGTLSNNLAGSPPRAQRRIYSYRIPIHRVEETRLALKEQIQRFRLKCREILRGHEETTDQGIEVGIGIYEFIQQRDIKIEGGNNASPERKPK